MTKKLIAILTVFAILLCNLPMVSLANENPAPLSLEEVNKENKKTANTTNENTPAATPEASNEDPQTQTAGETQPAKDPAENAAPAEEVKPAVESPVSNETKPSETAEDPAPAAQETPAAEIRSLRAPSPQGPSYVGEVTFVGQWVGESSTKKDTKKAFAKATDTLGGPEVNHGSLKSLAKIFLGWSDMQPTENAKLPEGAKLFSSEDPISLAFPDGIPTDAKLYGVYFELNGYGQAFTNWDTLSLINIAGKFKTLINENKTHLNKDMEAENVLPDTNLAEETKENSTRKIVDYYVKKDDTSSINEVVLNSEFEMNKFIAMLVYKNPVGSNAYRPILSFDYNTRYGESGEFNTKDGKAAEYTYTDLVVKLDPDIKVPETLYLEFSGYSWRPIYVFGENKEQLNIINPATGTILGNDKTAFSNLVSNTSPATRFAVETKGNHILTVRVVLREGQNEKISEASVIAEPGMSKIDKITENMTLKSLSKSDLKNLMPGLSEEEYNAKVLRVEDSIAKTLADTEAEESLAINGHVVGHVVAWAGSVSLPILGNTQLKSDTAITKIESNTELLSYIKKTQNVTYTFLSSTDGKDLPAEVIDLQPQDLLSQESGSKVDLPTFEDVKVKDGTWSFKNWSLDKNGSLEEITGEVIINDEDLSLVGQWEFTPFKISYEFESTDGSPLPEDILNLLPKPVTASDVDGKVSLSSFNDVEAKDGSWTFTGWFTKDKDGKLVAVTEEVLVDGSDLVLVGQWKFTKKEAPIPEPTPEPKPEPTPEPKPEQPKPQPAPQPNDSPKTGDNTNFLIYGGVILLCAVAIVVLRKIGKK